MAKRPPFSRLGEQAIQAFQEAAIADAVPRSEVGGDMVYGRSRHGASHDGGFVED